MLKIFTGTSISHNTQNHPTDVRSKIACFKTKINFGSLKHIASMHVSVLTWKYNAGNLQNNTIIIIVSCNEILLRQNYLFFAIPYSALNFYSLPFFSSPHLALLLVPVNTV